MPKAKPKAAPTVDRPADAGGAPDPEPEPRVVPQLQYFLSDPPLRRRRTVVLAQRPGREQPTRIVIERRRRGE